MGTPVSSVMAGSILATALLTPKTSRGPAAGLRLSTLAPNVLVSGGYLGHLMLIESSTPRTPSTLRASITARCSWSWLLAKPLSWTTPL
jgi:hypothetical protein